MRRASLAEDAVAVRDRLAPKFKPFHMPQATVDAIFALQPGNFQPRCGGVAIRKQEWLVLPDHWYRRFSRPVKLFLADSEYSNFCMYAAIKFQSEHIGFGWTNHIVPISHGLVVGSLRCLLVCVVTR